MGEFILFCAIVAAQSSLKVSLSISLRISLMYRNPVVMAFSLSLIASSTSKMSGWYDYWRGTYCKFLCPRYSLPLPEGLLVALRNQQYLKVALKLL